MNYVTVFVRDNEEEDQTLRTVQNIYNGVAYP